MSENKSPAPPPEGGEPCPHSWGHNGIVLESAPPQFFWTCKLCGKQHTGNKPPESAE